MTQPVTTAAIVRQHARATPDTIAFTFGEEAMSFAQLDRGSNRAANALAAEGVKRGDRIAYLGKNHHLYFELLLGRTRSAR